MGAPPICLERRRLGHSCALAVTPPSRCSTQCAESANRMITEVQCGTPYLTREHPHQRRGPEFSQGRMFDVSRACMYTCLSRRHRQWQVLAVMIMCFSSSSGAASSGGVGHAEVKCSLFTTTRFPPLSGGQLGPDFNSLLAGWHRAVVRHRQVQMGCQRATVGDWFVWC